MKQGELTGWPAVDDLGDAAEGNTGAKPSQETWRREITRNAEVDQLSSLKFLFPFALEEGAGGLTEAYVVEAATQSGRPCLRVHLLR